jgi:hypothetical protein
MTKLRAASVHLGICIVIAIVLLLLLWFVWYPAPLLRAVGGQEIFLMLLAIDVTLGPLLTFVVFKQGKKTLKLDLAVIGLVQTAALVYGVYVLLAGRPVYIAATGNLFQVVSASDVLPEDLKTANTTLPWWGPKWVGTKKSDDKNVHEQMVLSGLAGGGYAVSPQYHVPLETMRERIRNESAPIQLLFTNNPGRENDIRAWLANHNRDESTVVYQALKAHNLMSVIIDKKTGEVIGIAPFKPRA